MWLVDVVVRRYIYIFLIPHITYPYTSCICSFLQQYPYILFYFLNVCRCCYQYFFGIYVKIFHAFSPAITRTWNTWSRTENACVESTTRYYNRGARGRTYTPADHRRMRLRGNVYRSSITDVKRRYIQLHVYETLQREQNGGLERTRSR